MPGYYKYFTLVHKNVHYLKLIEIGHTVAISNHLCGAIAGNVFVQGLSTKVGFHKNGIPGCSAGDLSASRNDSHWFHAS